MEEEKSLFEQFQSALEEDTVLATDILIEHEKFWSDFEESPPTWKNTYEIVRELFRRKEQGLAVTVMRNMFGIEDRYNEIALDVDLSSETTAVDVATQSCSVKETKSVSELNGAFTVQAVGEVTSNHGISLDGELEFHLSEDGLSLRGFRRDPELDDE